MHLFTRMLVLAAVVAGLVSLPAYGEYYQFTDVDGVQRFTDDIASVPPDQRPDVKIHESVKSAPVRQSPQDRKAGIDSPDTMPRSGDAPLQTGTWNEKTAGQAKELDRIQVGLVKTSRSLQAERDALAAKKPSAGASDDDRAAYRRQVKQLNQKIDDYEARYAEFKKNEKDFNDQYRK